MANTYTTNLNLAKPGQGDFNFHTPINNNFDLIDSAYGSVNSVIDDLPDLYIYTDTFNGTTGTTIALPKEVDAVNEYAVKIEAIARTAAIGDIWVEKATDEFVVKCSGGNTADDFNAVLYYLGDISAYGGSIYRRWYVSPDSGITDHSDDTDEGSLAWVIDQIGASPAIIEFPGNHTYVIDDDVDGTANIDHLIFSFQPGAVIQPAAGKSFTVYNSESIVASPKQQIINITNNSTDPLVLTTGGTVHPGWFGCMGDGTTDDATAMQCALDLWKTLGDTGEGGAQFKLAPGANYLINTALTVTFTGDGDPATGAVTRNLDMNGYGATLTSGLSSGIMLTISTTNELIRYLSVRGMRVVGSGSEGGIIKIDGGDPANKEYIYAMSLEDLSSEGFDGNGIHISGNVFETALSRCHLFGSSGNTTGYPILFQKASGTISSIDVRDCITRYGLIGLYAESPVGDIKIYGGTYILAQQYGISVVNGTGCLMSGVHAENNWQSASSHDSEQAGIYLGNRGTIIGCLGTTNEYQSSLARIYSDSSISLINNHVGGDSTHHYFVHGTSGSSVQIVGDGIYDAQSGTSIAMTRFMTYDRDGTYRVTSGTGEDTLESFTIPGGIIGNVGGVKVVAAGTKTGSNGNKTLKFYLGSSFFTFHAAANNTNDWSLEVIFSHFNGQTSQRVMWRGYDGTTLLQGFESWAEDASGDLLMKITGECADAGDSIRKYIWDVKAI